MVVCVFVPVGLSTRPNSATRAFNEGVKLFNARQFNQAVSSFDEAISSDPDFAEALYARGSCKYYLKSTDAALMDLNAALRLKPDYLEARSLRGALHYEADRWDEAIQDFNAVLNKDPSEAQALLGRGIIRLKREELDGAERDFRNFLRVRPDDPVAPQLRKVLASLHPKEGSGGEGSRPVSSRAPSRPRTPPVDYQKMADGLLGPSMSESYHQKVMRGENPQAVGDIHSVPSVSKPPKPADSGYVIVDPE